MWKLTCRLLLAAVIIGGSRASGQGSVAVQPGECSIASATPWMEKWFNAWKLTSQHILRVPEIQAPHMVLFDSRCVYTTSEVSASGPAVRGPSPGSGPLMWRAVPHGDSLTLPNNTRMPVTLTSFTNVDKKTGRPFFVMSAPSYWQERGVPGDVTPVFLHEFGHTRQVNGLGKIIGPIDDNWKYPEELSDDAVQDHFKGDSVYVAAYLAERDLFYRAADAPTDDEARTLAKQALGMMRDRHARWFTGDKEVFAILDDTFLSLEGAAQWTAHAWLAHPEGEGMAKQAAVARMLGRRRFWSQDEGLAIFLVVDRLVPGWPTMVFNDPSVGVIALLERAVSVKPQTGQVQ